VGDHSVVLARDTVPDSVEASESSSKSLVGGLVVNIGVLKLSNSLLFEDFDARLEGLGEHEFVAEGVLEDFVVFSLLAVGVLLGSLNQLLFSFLLDLGVLVHCVFNFLNFDLSSETVCLHLLAVQEAKRVNLLGVLVALVVLELLEFSGSFLSLFLNLGLFQSGLFLEVAESLSEGLVERLDCGVVVSLDLGHDDVLLLSELEELTGDIHSDGLSFVMLLLSVLSLEIFEISVRRDEDFGDLNSLEVDTPALDDFLHFLLDIVTDLGAVSQAFVKSHVSDLVTDDRAGLLLDVVVSGLRVSGSQIITKVGESFERHVLFTRDLPDDHSLDVDSTHLAGDLLGFEGDHLRGGWEFVDLVPRHLEGSESNFGLLAYTTVCDDHPLVTFTGDPECLQVLTGGQGSLDESTQDNNGEDTGFEQSPNKLH
jgi:hypothetical protein